MTGLDLVLFHWLHGVLSYNRLAVEMAYFMADYAPIMVISVLATYFFVETRNKDQVRLTLLVALLAAGLSLISAVLIADAFYRPHPNDILESTRLLISHDRYSSFPNVTTAWCAAVAVTMLRTPNRLMRGFFVGTGILIGVTRPILGDHWPTDILASFVLGGLSSHLAFKVAEFAAPIMEWFLGVVSRAERRWLD
ncbi:MAG TPA: phosphatase PAP2 family protein [Symbiobacteriaceae bacterium]|jgi:undecaprenyl-diphosphatase|nr:phosphatase PAP2 family protein [Symbiobacteriaceae bacterium]